MEVPTHKAAEHEAIQTQIEEFLKTGKKAKKAKQGEVAQGQRGLSESEKYRFNEANARI
jgi:hypothetical protein